MSTMASRGLRKISGTWKTTFGKGASLEETAEFLCRGGTVEVVVEKAEQLGLTSQHPPNASHKTEP